MSKHTSASATPQLSAFGARISRAIRRHLMGIAVGGTLAAALVAPSASLATAPLVRLASHTTGYSLMIANSPQSWGCGGAPTDC